MDKEESNELHIIFYFPYHLPVLCFYLLVYQTRPLYMPQKEKVKRQLSRDYINCYMSRQKMSLYMY